jgi:hypothetical protein
MNTTEPIKNEEGNIIFYDPRKIIIPSIPPVNTVKQTAKLTDFQERAASKCFSLLFGEHQAHSSIHQSKSRGW